MYHAVSRRRPALPVAFLAVLAALSIAACGGSATKHTSSSTGTPNTATGSGSGTTTAPAPGPAGTSRSGNAGLVSIFGGANQLISNPGGTLQALKALGVQTVRIDVHWSNIAPDSSATHPPAGFKPADPASYGTAWLPLDQAVSAAHSEGINVLATIGGPAPLWAEQPGDPRQKGEPQGIWKPKPAAFAAFVRAVGKRYSGSYTPKGATNPLPRLDLWSVWNEPNYGQDLAPQATDHSAVEVAPALYRGLLDAAWSALQSTGHGHDTILFGELAPHGQTVGNVPGDFGGMVPLRFLRALYCVNASFQRLTGTAATARGCPDAAASEAAAGSSSFKVANPALFEASGLAMHLYLIGPVAPTVSAPNEPDFADLSKLGTLEHTLDRLQATYGSGRRLDIWNTEFGYQTDPPEPDHLNPTRAAAYLNQAEYMSWRDPRVRSYDQYLLTDAATIAGKLGFNTGLEFSNGKPKATYGAYQMPIYLPQTTAHAGRPIEVWGCARPAPDAAEKTGSSQHVEIQFARTGSQSFTTVRTVTLPRTSCYFDVKVPFPDSGSVRLQWQQPGTGLDQSRSVAVTATGS